MTGNDAGLIPVVGGPARHVPVLLADAVTALNLTAGGCYLDGTFGAGGYARAILDAGPDVRLLALDRDPAAIAAGAALAAETNGRLTLRETTFGDLDTEAAHLGFAPLDGIVLDIGVSSMQIDQPDRGFSFRFDGPLDMRMGNQGTSAADLVNEADEATLANIVYYYGEERRSRAVARAIIEARRTEPVTTTKRLAQIVATVVRAEPGGANPATRTFQALRIAVNDELGELVRALHAAERILKPGGRLAVVTFHSLEDRIVKLFLSERSGRTPAGSRHAPAAARPGATFSLVTKGPIAPSSREMAENSRARSAKLRVAARTAEPARNIAPELAALAELPETKPRRRG